MRTSESICSLAHSPERGPEWGAGRADQFIFSLPFLYFSPFLSWSPGSLRQIETREQNSAWLNISHSLSVYVSLIGSTRDGYVSGLAQTIWPHRILLSLSNFALGFNKWPILAHFALHVYDKREWTYEQRNKWVRKGREETLSLLCRASLLLSRVKNIPSQ